MSAWVFLLLGGMDSIVFGPIRWCVWSFRPSSPLRLPHLKFLFVCLFDVVDLPDILLPAGQYLDLFDSESETDVPSDSSDEELVEV